MSEWLDAKRKQRRGVTMDITESDHNPGINRTIPPLPRLAGAIESSKYDAVSTLQARRELLEAVARYERTLRLVHLAAEKRRRPPTGDAVTVTVGLTTTEDVVSFLTAQHEEIKALFAQVESGHGIAREKSFVELRRLLAVHEAAEENSVHPLAGREIRDGERIIEARLREENAAGQAIAVLEEMDTDSVEFDTAFDALHTDVLAHADAEEREEFDQLATALDDADMDRMRQAARLAEQIVSHPGAGAAAENMLVGTFAAMLDRARDLIAGKS